MAEEQAMEKLANELIERLGSLEAENTALKKDNADLRNLNQQLATAKTASLNDQVKQVSDDLLDATCNELVKCGALNADQVAQSKEIFKSDPDAPFKVIRSLLDDRAQIKSASEQESLRGGRLVGIQTPKDADAQECLERMRHTLGLY